MSGQVVRFPAYPRQSVARELATRICRQIDEREAGLPVHITAKVIQFPVTDNQRALVFPPKP